MARYELVDKESVAKDLRPIPNQDVARILHRVEELQEDPRSVGSEKLSGQEPYRIIYEVTGELLTVTVVKVGHRKAVYKPS